MLGLRFSSDCRPRLRPLVWLAVTTMATSTSPAIAQTVASSSATPHPSASAEAAAPSAPPKTEPFTTTPKDEGAGLRTAGYILGGLGIAGFVLFAVAGISAKNAHDRLDESCAAGNCNDAAHASDIEDGKLFQTAANIGLAAGLTGLGFGATLIVLGGNHATNEPAPATASAPSGGMVTFSGRF